MTLSLVAFSAGCDSMTVSSADVGDVVVSPSTAVVPEGAEVQFFATVLDAEGNPMPGRSVSWSSNAPSIATVDGDGLVRGVAFGTAAITAAAGGEVGSAVAMVGQPPRIRVDPNSLSFSAPEGQGAGAEVVIVTNIGELPLDDLAAVITYNGAARDWLQVSYDRTLAPANLTVSAAATGLIRGTYSATVSVVAPLADNSPVDIPITFAVSPSGPEIVAAPSPVQLSSTAPQQTLAITNGGSGSLTGLTSVVSYDGAAGWLAASLAGSSAPTSLTLSAVVGGLADGTYGATVEVHSAEPGVDPLAIPVTLSVTPLPPSLTVDPAQVSLAAAQNAGPSVTTVSVTNSGDGSIGGLSRSVSYGAGQPTGWLTASLSGQSTPATLTVSANPAGLSAGSYAAVVEVAGDAPNSPQLVQVSFSVIPPPLEPPAAPSGLGGSVTATREVTLTWVDESDNEVSFRVERRPAGSGTGPWAEIAAPTANSTSYADTGVTPGVTYRYRVRACNSAGCSAYSNVIEVAVPLVPPATPSYLNLSALLGDEVQLFWDPVVELADWFEIQRRRLPANSWSFVAAVDGDENSYTDEGLRPVTTYEYRIRACNEAGCSAWTNPSRVTTPADSG